MKDWTIIESAKQAALEVMLHNANGPFEDLPRTAGWGYPEPYTRDLLISILGIAVTGNHTLTESIKKVLQTLSKNQSHRGHIPSLVHDPFDRGASDTTPLFLVAVGIFRKYTGEDQFLQVAVDKALTWMEYQSPNDDFLVAQQPTSDWRDEQWTIGYGLYVNTLTYCYLKMLGFHERAHHLKLAMEHFTITKKSIPPHLHEGMALMKKPYYAFWSYKLYSSVRFDLLGNSLAILTGLANRERSNRIISWIEKKCLFMKKNGEVKLNLPPNFFPFILPGDGDWLPRYQLYNNPGDYHNGGIWPYISSIYIAALVASGKHKLAYKQLKELTRLITIPVNKKLSYGFNEWYKAQNGEPMGQDWQTWSASLYLYAVKCVEDNTTPFFNQTN
jgi:hypothetical protein